MVGSRMKQLRKKRGFSLSELADRAGVAKSYLSSIENGKKSNPSIQILEKISSVLGVNIETLLGTAAKDEILDQDWLDLTEEALRSGISKKQFKDFMELYKRIHGKWGDRI